MTGILGGIADIASRGFQWWTTELADLLPGEMPANRSAARADVIVGVDAKGELQSLDVAKRGRLPSGEPRQAHQSEVLESLTRLSLSQPETSVRLRLPSSACLERRIDIPPSARHQAKSILGLDLERSTPFKMTDVYWAESYAPASDRKGWLTASQFIIKRKAADKAIATIEELGLQVEGVDCWTADGKEAVPVNFLSADNERANVGRSRHATLALSVLAIGLAVSAAWLSISRREAVLSNLERDVGIVRAKVDSERQTQIAADEVRRDNAAVRAWKYGHVSSVEILNELTRLLPDDVTLNDFKRDGDTIDISGLAKSAVAVIPIIERSSMFTDALLTAPVTFDAAIDKERLNLRIKLRHAPKTAAVNSSGEVAK